MKCEYCGKSIKEFCAECFKDSKFGQEVESTLITNKKKIAKLVTDYHKDGSGPWEFSLGPYPDSDTLRIEMKKLFTKVHFAVVGERRSRMDERHDNPGCGCHVHVSHPSAWALSNDTYQKMIAVARMHSRLFHGSPGGFRKSQEHYASLSAQLETNSKSAGIQLYKRTRVGDTVKTRFEFRLVETPPPFSTAAVKVVLIGALYCSNKNPSIHEIAAAKADPFLTFTKLERRVLLSYQHGMTFSKLVQKYGPYNATWAALCGRWNPFEFTHVSRLPYLRMR